MTNEAFQNFSINFGEYQFSPFAPKTLAHVPYEQPIQRTSELKRIFDLPRRDLTMDLAEEFARLVTEEYRRPNGEMVLWPMQGAALAELALYGRCFVPLGVGQGKALISLLAPWMTDAERPLLIVPAELRDQTNEVVIPEMTDHWKLHPNLTVIGYSELQPLKNHYILDNLNPDLIILDECHYLVNKKSGRSRRVIRWFEEHNTPCIAMSGTMLSRSVKDFAHIIGWTHREGSPLPTKVSELTRWAEALDISKRAGRANSSAEGALRCFCRDDSETLASGFQRRLTETEGVVSSNSDKLKIPLVIRERTMDVPPIIMEHMKNLANTWTTPSGYECCEAVEVWAHMRELAMGFYYKWDPDAPDGWKSARKDYNTLVRERIRYSRGTMDTELQVRRYMAKNEPSNAEYSNWMELKPTFKPNSVPVWLDYFVLDFCRDWLDNADNGIIWVEQVCVGAALKKEIGLTYFGAGKKEILYTKERKIAASISSHRTGKNLQRFSNNLVLCPTSAGKTWEQMLGRTHRHGQAEKEVICDVLTHTPELYASFQEALQNAKWIEESLGNLQKINYAKIVKRN